MNRDDNTLRNMESYYVGDGDFVQITIAGTGVTLHISRGVERDARVIAYRDDQQDGRLDVYLGQAHFHRDNEGVREVPIEELF